MLVRNITKNVYNNPYKLAKAIAVRGRPFNSLRYKICGNEETSTVYHIIKAKFEPNCSSFRIIIIDLPPIFSKTIGSMKKASVFNEADVPSASNT